MDAMMKIGGAEKAAIAEAGGLILKIITCNASDSIKEDALGTLAQIVAAPTTVMGCTLTNNPGSGASGIQIGSSANVKDCTTD